MPPEPVSPELILVDPELARRERARLEEKAYLRSVLDAVPPRRASDSQPTAVEETMRHRSRWRDAATFSKRRLVPATLMCSLLVNGFLVANLATRKGEEATQGAVRMVPVTESAPRVSAPTVPPISGVPKGEREARPATKVSTMVPATKGALERKVVSLVLAAPVGKLPREFIDPTTGLIKNNVQVVCGKSKHRSFLCAVRLPSDSARRALYVRYRTDKKGHRVFTWYGYRRN